MPLCRNCNTDSPFARTIFGETPAGDRDECPNCTPQSFDKFAAPSDKKIWIGPEYAPNDYEKRYDSEGVYYMPKPEVTAEREKNLFVDTEEKQKYERAVEKKRREGRKDPLTPEEVAEAIKRAEAMVRPMIEDPETTYLV